MNPTEARLEQFARCRNHSWGMVLSGHDKNHLSLQMTEFAEATGTAIADITDDQMLVLCHETRLVNADTIRTRKA